MTNPQLNTPPPGGTGDPAATAIETPARPALVTATTVVALIWGGLTILSSLVSMVGGSLVNSTGRACAPNDESGLCAFVGDSSGLLIVLGSALIVAAVIVIWGGVIARQGKNATVLVIASGIQIVIQIVWLIDTGSIAFGIVGVIVPIAIIGFIMSPTSRAWFQGSGDTTF